MFCHTLTNANIIHHRTALFTMYKTVKLCQHCEEYDDYLGNDYDLDYGFEWSFAKCQCQIQRISFSPPIPDDVNEFERPYYYIVKHPVQKPNAIVYRVTVEKVRQIHQIDAEFGAIEYEFDHQIGSMDPETFRDEVLQWTEFYLYPNKTVKGVEKYEPELINSFIKPVVASTQKECTHIGKKKGSRAL